MSKAADEEIRKLLLGEDSASKQEPLPLPEKVPITAGTLEKAQTICEVVRSLTGQAYEWFSFLLASRADPDYVVRDLLLVEGTKATIGHVEVDGVQHARVSNEVQKINQESGKDYYVIGWMHSHGDGPLRPSQTDDQNFVQLLNSIRFNTDLRVPTALPLIESALTREVRDGSIIVTGENVEDAIIRYAIPDETRFAALLEKYGLVKRKEVQALPQEEFFLDLVQALDMKTEEPHLIGFGYSIIVNEKRATPYAEIGLVEEKIISQPGKRFLKRQVTSLDIRTIDDDINVELEEIRKLVKQRIRFYDYGQRMKRHRRSSAVGTASSPDAPGQYETYSPYSSSGLELKTSSETSAAPGSATGTKTGLYQKQELQGITMNELVDLFLLRVQGYLTLFRYTGTKYSSYVDGLMERLYSGSSVSITEAIWSLGQLEEDGEMISEPLYHGRPYWTGVITRELVKRTTRAEAKQAEIEFMMDFVVGERNKALEEHVPRLLAARPAQYGEQHFFVGSGGSPAKDSRRAGDSNAVEDLFWDGDYQGGDD